MACRVGVDWDRAGRCLSFVSFSELSKLTPRLFFMRQVDDIVHFSVSLCCFA